MSDDLLVHVGRHAARDLRRYRRMFLDGELETLAMEGAWRALGTYDETRGALYDYMLLKGRQHAKNKIRTRARQVAFVELAAEPACTPEHESEDAETLLRFIARFLPADLVEIVRQVAFLDMPRSEVAKHIGVSASAVCQRLRNIRKVEGLMEAIA